MLLMQGSGVGLDAPPLAWGLRRSGTENRFKPSGYKETLSLPLFSIKMLLLYRCPS